MNCRVLTLVLFLGLPLLVAPNVSAADAPKTVLIFTSEHQHIPAVQIVNQAILKTMESRLPRQVQFFYEAQDNFRIPNEKYESELVGLMRRKYEGVHIDLIFVYAAPAIRFLVRHRDELFTNTPIVFISVDPHRLANLDLGQNVTGVGAKLELKPTLDVALALQPETKRVIVVAGLYSLDSDLVKRAREEFRPFEGKVDFTYLIGLPLEELRSKLAVLPEHNIIFYLTFSSDSSGKTYNNQEVLSMLTPSANAPIYVAIQTFFGDGTVGGSLLDFEAIGTRAGETGLRILAGEKPKDIPLQLLPSTTMFDWRQLRRWGIDEAKLPPGSIVRYKEFSVWELYKWHIIGAVALIILQALLIIGLLINRSRRRQAERDSERFGELARAEHRRLDEVVSNIPGLVWEVSIDPASGKRKTEFVSRYVEQMLGYCPEDFEGRTGFGLSLIPEEDRERVERQTNEVLSGGTSGAMQFRWLTKEGRALWVESQVAPILDESGKPIGLRGVTMDITERKHIEESLRESEHRFQLVSEATKDILYEWNLQTGGVWWNDSAMRSVFGYPLEEMRHDVNWWDERLHPEDKDRINVSVTEVLAGLEQKWENEYRFRKMDNSYAHVYHRAFIIRDDEGQALKVIGSLMDFTERKQSEEKLRSALEEVSLLKNQLQEENLYLQEEIKLAHNVDEIIGRSNAIKYVLFKIEQVSKTDSTVMILGETGTGKELVARAIHSQSQRKDRPLIKVNCAALSAGLIESELFGHEKGSFTGAVARKIGRFEVADGATLFLDEIGELPLDLQSKLLRVIQEGEFERLGSSKTIKVDVRIIAATNRNMKAEVQKGAFREDLWYRLNVFPITVPPLRQRKEDIPPMVEHFVSSFSRNIGKNITAVSSATLKKLEDYSWPGNVRELANVIERGVINAQAPVLHITDQFEQTTSSQPTGTSHTLDEIEKEYITRILGDTAWKIEGPNGAAKILGLNPSTLRTRMVKLGIQKGAHNSAKG